MSEVLMGRGTSGVLTCFATKNSSSKGHFLKSASRRISMVDSAGSNSCATCTDGCTSTTSNNGMSYNRAGTGRKRNYAVSQNNQRRNIFSPDQKFPSEDLTYNLTPFTELRNYRKNWDKGSQQMSGQKETSHATTVLSSRKRNTKTEVSCPQEESLKLKPMKLQFFRTKLCPWVISMGHCRKGEGCRYAHSQAQLRPLPDLAKTKLCEALSATGKCADRSICKYAHTAEELRATNSFCKTKLCPRFVAGNCSAGSFCRFAHGEDELRDNSIMADEKGPVGNQAQSVENIEPQKNCKQMFPLQNNEGRYFCCYEETGILSNRLFAPTPEAQTTDIREQSPNVVSPIFITRGLPTGIYCSASDNTNDDVQDESCQLSPIICFHSQYNNKNLDFPSLYITNDNNSGMYSPVSAKDDGEYGASSSLLYLPLIKENPSSTQTGTYSSPVILALSPLSDTPRDECDKFIAHLLPSSMFSPMYSQSRRYEGGSPLCSYNSFESASHLAISNSAPKDTPHTARQQALVKNEIAEFPTISDLDLSFELRHSATHNPAHTDAYKDSDDFSTFRQSRERVISKHALLQEKLIGY